MVLESKDLCFKYMTGRPVFWDVSFSVATGEVLFLLGPNGAGKSTLLKCLTGLLKPQKGQISVKGQPLNEYTPRERAQLIGYVPQNQASTFPYTIEDVIIMGRTPHIDAFAAPKETDRAAAWKAMETTGIAHLAGRNCQNVSGGEWQLTLIARALAQQPHLLLLDEPTSHLDPGNQARVLTIIKNLACDGYAVVVASHFPDHAFLLATRAAVIKDGRFMAYGPPMEVITSRLLTETYGFELQVAGPHERLKRPVCILERLKS